MSPRGDSHRFERKRAGYDLQKIGPLLVSNSPTRENELVKSKKEGVEVNVGWLIRNTSSAPVSVNLENAVMIANGDKTPLNCLANRSVEKKNLPSYQSKNSFVLSFDSCCKFKKSSRAQRYQSTVSDSFWGKC